MSIRSLKWKLKISSTVNPWQILQLKYFYKHFIQAGCKLQCVAIYKSNLTDDEKSLLTLCLSSVFEVSFYCLVELHTQKKKVEKVSINVASSSISEDEFEKFAPWISAAKELVLELNRKAKYFPKVCGWILKSANIVTLKVRHGQTCFNSLKELQRLHFHNNKSLYKKKFPIEIFYIFLFEILVIPKVWWSYRQTNLPRGGLAFVMIQGMLRPQFIFLLIALYFLYCNIFEILLFEKYYNLITNSF